MKERWKQGLSCNSSKGLVAEAYIRSSIPSLAARRNATVIIGYQSAANIEEMNSVPVQLPYYRFY